MCIKCEKHYLTNSTRSISLTPVTKRSLRGTSTKVPEDKFCVTDATTWNGKLVPKSASISFKLLEQPFFYAIPMPEFWLSHLMISTA